RPPIAVWREHEASLALRMPKDRMAFWVSFLPDAHRTLRPDGIWLHDIPYWSNAIALMRALLVQTWRPCGANGRDPVVGWALGTIFPEFDDLARPIKRRINHAAVAAL